MPHRTRRLLAAGIALSFPVAGSAVASTPVASTTSSCATRVAAAARRTDAGGRYARVARSSAIEVFSPRGTAFGAYHYLCRRSTGKLHRFARNSGGAADLDVLTTSIVVRGADVAYRTSVRGDGRATERFVVRDGRSGKVLRDTGAVPSTETAAPRTDQLLLLHHATIAWGTRDAGVHVTDRRGDHVIADPTGRQPTRLAATATRLSWTEAGRRRTARLP